MHLFINDIEKLFEDIESFQIGSKSVTFLLYADYLFILWKSQFDLQLSFSCLHKYTLNWGLKINIKVKSHCCKYGKRNYEIFIDGTILEQVDFFTYLQKDFHRTENFNYASQSLFKKGLKE